MSEQDNPVVDEPEKKPKKGTSAWRATKDLNIYKTAVAEDLALHHRMIAELHRRLAAVEKDIEELLDAQPKIEVVQTVVSDLLARG